MCVIGCLQFSKYLNGCASLVNLSTASHHSKCLSTTGACYSVNCDLINPPRIHVASHSKLCIIYITFILPALHICSQCRDINSISLRARDAPPCKHACHDRDLLSLTWYVGCNSSSCLLHEQNVWRRKKCIQLVPANVLINCISCRKITWSLVW